MEIDLVIRFIWILQLSTRNNSVKFQMSKQNSNIKRVQIELQSLGIDTEIIELPASTRTALEASRAVECYVGQIVKSLIFEGISSQKPILILTSGSNQVDENLVSTEVGEKIKFASAEIVRIETGFAIGGVSPFGLKKKISKYIDVDLLQYPFIWAAAGSPNAVFSIHPDILVNSVGAKVISVHSTNLKNL